MYYLDIFLEELRKTKIVLWLRFGPCKYMSGMRPLDLACCFIFVCPCY